MAREQTDLTARARRVKLLLLDVDGVLTDATVVVSGEASEAKSFSIRDGFALVWARRQGLDVGLLSGRPSPATARRAAELGITLVLQPGPLKREPFLALLAERGLAPEDVAYMGDDLPDLPVMRRAGLSAAPADAAREVLDKADWVSQYPGGRGAVREFVELLLTARGAWASVVAAYQD
jgi:3-deoxy-D-manno-octulosonate 8-phosphate phosphatase (KDO 8-P phosphatase)